jgi:1-acylglycerone phosphate reductase
MGNPTVLITGCTKGSIGYSLAKEFSARNYHVYAATRRIQTMGDLGSVPNITLLALDVTSRESLLAAHAQISKETDGKLDILYHNAGYRSLGMAVETSLDEALKMFNANFFGILEMNEIFADLVIASKGKIVFTGSVSGYTPHPSQSVYCASKAALELYARTLRIEMKPFAVRVVFVNTAAVNTGMSSERVSLAQGDVNLIPLTLPRLRSLTKRSSKTPNTNISRQKSTKRGQISRVRRWTRTSMPKR